jgi:subtilase family serine protease
MKQLPRRALLGTIVLLCLLAGAFAPPPHRTAAAEPLADLVVTNIAWSPHEPAQGETITFTVTVRNQGDAPADASQLECFIDGASAARIEYSPIGPGITTTCTFTWPAASGEHNIRAVVDPGNEIEESNDGNNDVTYAFSVLTPDLFIESITWEPQEPEIREPVVFSVTVKNRGNRYARASNVELFIDNVSRGY